MQTFGFSGANLKLLRAFDAVARHKSFSKGAAELGRAQATVSAQIRELEQRLDVRLFDRTTRRVALTAAGERLAEAVESGFRTIDAGINGARKVADGQRHRIVVACVPSLSASRLPGILAGYRTRDRTTRIDVAELTSSEIVAALLVGTVDFGVGPCVNPPPPEIAFAAIVEEPLVVVLPRCSDFGSDDGIPFETLASLPLLTLSGSVLLQQELERVAKDRGLRLSSQTEVRHVQTAVAMARAGVGIAIVPRLALPDDLDSSVRVVPVVSPQLSRQVGIVTLRGTPLLASAERLARYFRTALVRAIDGTRN